MKTSRTTMRSREPTVTPTITAALFGAAKSVRRARNYSLRGLWHKRIKCEKNIVRYCSYPLEWRVLAFLACSPVCSQGDTSMKLKITYWVIVCLQQMNSIKQENPLCKRIVQHSGKDATLIFSPWELDKKINATVICMPYMKLLLAASKRSLSKGSEDLIIQWC